MDLEKLTSRLSSEDNLINNLGMVKGEVVVKEGSKLAIVKPFTNRPGPKHTPDEVKELVGTLAHLDSQKNVAKAFGLSQAQVSNYKNGINSSCELGSFDGELKKRIDTNVEGVKEKVGKLALGRLESILSGITDEKIEKANLVSLSAAASSLAKIARVGEEEEKGDRINNFVFYAPRQRHEDDYEVVSVA